MAKKKTSTKKNKIILSCVLSCFVVILALCVYLYETDIIPTNYFYNNTKINGINVSGMTKKEAANAVATKLLKERKDIEINLNYNDKNWKLLGEDFEIDNNVFGALESSLKYGKNSSFYERIKNINLVKKNGLNYNVSYRFILGNFDEKIDGIISKITQDVQEPKIVFNPNKNKMFSITKGHKGTFVNKNLLYEKIDNALENSLKINVEIPTFELSPKIKEEDLLKQTKLRSKFQTTLKNSAPGRRHNVGVALSAFNGKIIQPDEEVSFNSVISKNTKNSDYQKAIIILNGVYVQGLGGGVCQASSTLYNALVLADADVLEVHPHSLPVSYVPLALDAMVYENSSDLRFKNTTKYPLYIKTFVTKDSANVEIYGMEFKDGEEIKTRSEFVETLPHNGDKIIQDKDGKYSKKITFKGEYLRLKYPHEGYHSKAIKEYYKDGKLVKEKTLREEFYAPQDGIVIEGTQDLFEGMTLPENTVKIIPPQTRKKITKDSAIHKIKNTNPSDLNP